MQLISLRFWLYSNRWETFRSTTAGADDRPLCLYDASYQSNGISLRGSPLDMRATGKLGQ
ncbi:hypothetical protein PENSUB_1024 [Penicillium subrubescens]|uniref:Uncharacterized protein n=1 Tax=Penicillium subrubescens TaxID=1316194 RepID=A0A1Q5ULH2_9EURO|nr:hypothetical protein PENSUB_1024 [Penicillium subrubescens]